LDFLKAKWDEDMVYKKEALKNAKKSELEAEGQISVLRVVQQELKDLIQKVDDEIK
jgi:hypothetical protein